MALIAYNNECTPSVEVEPSPQVIRKQEQLLKEIIADNIYWTIKVIIIIVTLRLYYMCVLQLENSFVASIRNEMK